MAKKITLFLYKLTFLLIIPSFIKAQVQPTNLDSLQSALRKAPDDSVKMVALFNLAAYYIESNQDSCLYYADQGLIIGKKINQPLWVAHFLTEFQSLITMRQFNLPLSFKLANEALAITQNEKNEKDVYIPSDYEFKDPHKFRLSQIGYTIHQLGNIYSSAGNSEKAIEFYREENGIFESLKSKFAMAFVQANMNIGDIYAQSNKQDSALLYCNKALDYAKQTGWKAYNAYILKIIGNVYQKRNMTDSAKSYYWKSLSEANEQNSISLKTLTYIDLADMYKTLRQADSLKYYAKAALDLAMRMNFRYNLPVSAALASDAWKMKGNADSAFFYLSLSKRIGDSINADQSLKLAQFQKLNFEEQLSLEKTAQDAEARSNNIRTIGLIAGLVLLSALVFVFYRNNRRKHKANIVLQQQKQTIETTLSELQATQQQLIQSEKMASLGELTAGIAHEIQNPLNFVNNFSEVSTELVDEMNEEISKGNLDDAKEIANDLKQNLEKINHHGKRAGDIVKGMLQHSRTSSGQKEPTDINALCDEYLRLSYHGLRAKDKTFNAKFETDFDASLPKINIVPQEIGRVILNLINNAFYAVNERKKLNESGYEPTVTVSTKKEKDNVLISVKDNGTGIPQKLVEKIFQPFFTTKPTGIGTGLGLSLSYDIVTKGHGGEIKVETKEGDARSDDSVGRGTMFIISLPV